MGHTSNELQRAYEYLLTEEESFVRSIYKDSMPAELSRLGFDHAELTLAKALFGMAFTSASLKAR